MHAIFLDGKSMAISLDPSFMDMTRISALLWKCIGYKTTYIFIYVFVIHM